MSFAVSRPYILGKGESHLRTGAEAAEAGGAFTAPEEAAWEAGLPLAATSFSGALLGWADAIQPRPAATRPTKKRRNKDTGRRARHQIGALKLEMVIGVMKCRKRHAKGAKCAQGTDYFAD
ncbi:hypothetical protein [Aquabacterium sp. NJ1]|uniref:hypothetical protein n=1 Tax=Aquabacterium sp. NJ1 TaxID=1538295 RepID=UPI001F2746B0|nr:hypothetical protein [Aquabacterium sp. NJ1]